MKSTVVYACILASVTLLGACSSNPTLEDMDKKAAVAARANTQLGIEYLRDKNYEMALEKLQKAIEAEPDYAVAHDVIAILYAQVGDKGLAEKHYLHGLKLNPDNSDGHSNYGQFLCSNGRYQEAEQQFLIAANNRFYKTPELPLFNAGLCMAGVPDAAAAEKYYRLSLDKNPKFGPALYQMALLSYAGQDYLRTRAWLQRYQESENQTPESLWLAIRTEYALGDNQAWGNYSLQLRSRFPDSEQAKLLQEWEHERRSGN